MSAATTVGDVMDSSISTAITIVNTDVNNSSVSVAVRIISVILFGGGQ